MRWGTISFLFEKKEIIKTENTKTEMPKLQK